MRLIYKEAGSLEQLKEYLYQEESFLVVFRGSPDSYMEDIYLILEDFFKGHKDEASLYYTYRELRNRTNEDLLALYFSQKIDIWDAGSLNYFMPPDRIVYAPYLDALLDGTPKILYLD